jgi:hypothetical protein
MPYVRRAGVIRMRLIEDVLVAVSAENGDQVSPSLAGQPNVLRLARTCLTCGLRETSAVRLKRLLDGTGVR